MYACPQHTLVCTMRSYLLVIKDVRTAEERHLLAQPIVVCHGILGRQYLPEVGSRQYVNL